MCETRLIENRTGRAQLDTHCPKNRVDEMKPLLADTWLKTSLPPQALSPGLSSPSSYKDYLSLVSLAVISVLDFLSCPWKSCLFSPSLQ